jgi:hypothetical protein
VSYASEHPVVCAREGCTAFHPGSRFDAMKADRAGWFHSKAEGTAYCPAHIPDWVPAWRERQAARKFEITDTYYKLPATLQCQGCTGLTDTEENRDDEAAMKALRARGFEHARLTGHTVSIGSAQVLVIEAVKENADV